MYPCVDGGVAVAHGRVGRVDDGEVEVVLEPGTEVGGGEAAEGVARLSVEEGVAALLRDAREVQVGALAGGAGGWGCGRRG
eukprot:7019707-Prymnesium_polylepis.1